MPTGYRKASDLPQVIPVFPLDGVLLLPGGQLPLNIFEPRYLNMLDDVMAGERMIGMIQTRGGEDESLAWLMKVGVSALDGDATKVLNDFGANAHGAINGLLDPALADFALEIALRLEGDAGRPGRSKAVADRLRDVQARLARRLVEIKTKDFQG